MRALFPLFPLFPLLIAAALLSACAPKDDLAETPVPIGDFLLGHTIVVADKAQIGPLSRSATAEELQTSLHDAVLARMGRYQGDLYFHLGINIDAYALAIPGIPVVAKPKSILVASVTVWDDAKGVKVNPEPKQFFVFESTTPETFISSGLTQTKAQQLSNLSVNMARKIENWLRENEDWFGGVAARNPPGTKSALELPDDPVPGALVPGALVPGDPTVVPTN